MSFSIWHETVRILTDGFPGPPPSLERGETAAFATWVREPYGAVLFIRRWKNDQWDTDTAITARDSEGRWAEPDSYGGSGRPDPYHRPDVGRNEELILWRGEVSSTIGSKEGEVLVRVFEGDASPEVATLEVLDRTGQLIDVIQIRPDTGIFLIGVLGGEPHIVVAKGQDGRIVRDGMGREVRYVFDPPADTVLQESLRTHPGRQWVRRISE